MGIWLTVALTLPAALAQSRVVLQTTPAVQSALLDQRPMVPSNNGTRFLQTFVSPGTHSLAIHDLTGAAVYQGTLEVSASTPEVALQWSPAEGLRASTGALVATSSAVAPAPPTPTETARGIDTSGSNSRDPSAPHADATSASSSGDSRVGSAVVDLAAQATGIAPAMAVGGAVATGVADFVGSSPAGLSVGGPSPDARQGRPSPTPTIVGTVRILNSGTVPVVLYVDGMNLGTIAPGDTKTFKVGAGNPSVQFSAGGTPVAQGTLRVDPNVTFALEVAAGAEPRSPDRPWVWAPQSR